jgi:hypothetical protein
MLSGTMAISLIKNRQPCMGFYVPAKICSGEIHISRETNFATWTSRQFFFPQGVPNWAVRKFPKIRSCRVEFQVLTAIVMNVAISWAIEQCNPYVKRRLGGTYHLQLAARWFLARLFSTLKMEVMRSSETLVHIRTTRCSIPENGNIYSSRLRQTLMTDLGCRKYKITYFKIFSVLY